MSEERKDFYKKGLRPAVDRLVPLDMNDWPADYRGEMFRAKKRSGGMAYQTKMLPEFAVPYLIEFIRKELKWNGVEWGAGCIVLHTVRGTKHGTKHTVDEEAANLSIREFLAECQLPYDILEQGDWYIDVGLEFSSTLGHCLQWKTTSHFHFVKAALRIADNHASRITTLGSSKYQRDISSHLPALSGCRIEPGARAAGPFEAVYYQQYTNEKALTYNPERGHHGKSMTIKEAMDDRQQPIKFIEELYRLYLTAMETNLSNARVEVRVPINYTTCVLQDIDYNVIIDSLVSIPRVTWW